MRLPTNNVCYEGTLNRLRWILVAKDEYRKLYDVFLGNVHVASLLCGRQGPGAGFYHGINYVKGRTIFGRDIRAVELLMTASFLNPNC